MITVLILLFAIGILGWGFYRARPFGKLGILAWLQSVVLMTPWLLFFGLFAAGIYLNLAGVLFLLVTSIVLYIGLGKQLRATSKDLTASKLSAIATSTPSQSPTPDAATDATPDAAASPDNSAPSPALASMAMPADDLKAIQSIFGIDTYFVTETIPYQDGAIFKGNLRGEVEAIYARLSQALAEKMGDRYRLFLINGPDSKPVIVALPSTNDPKPMTTLQKIIAGVLMVAVVATSLETASFMLGFDVFSDLTRVGETVPIACGILLVLIAHEIGHRIWANRYAIRLSLPFFIPAWQIGSFGALTRFESLLPNRSVLFDIAFAGPALGGIVSLSMVILGLILSNPSSLFQIPAEFFQSSILVGALSRVILGSALQQPLVSVSPLMVVGWLGLVVTAINLMPAGQLDGGRIVQSIYGRKVAGRTTVATLILLGLASFVNPLALYWAIVILFLQRDLERPALNELTEPDDARAALGLLALFLMAATLLPLTPSLAGRLGIGG